MPMNRKELREALEPALKETYGSHPQPTKGMIRQTGNVIEEYDGIIWKISEGFLESKFPAYKKAKESGDKKAIQAIRSLLK